MGEDHLLRQQMPEDAIMVVADERMTTEVRFSSDVDCPHQFYGS